MTVSERELEENEARIDNVLHKIIGASEQINQLCSQINEHSKGEYLLDRIKKIKMLSEIIFHLSHLADDIDLKDEHLTEELEKEITHGLDKAIVDINEAKQLFEDI